MTLIYTLTVDGRDYYPRAPVDELKAAILHAVRDGGGYVKLPARGHHPAREIVFSPGTSVVWSSREVDLDLPPERGSAFDEFDFDSDHYI